MALSARAQLTSDIVWLDIVAGDNVAITGSDVPSQAGIGIVGQNVTIEAAQDSSHAVETQKFRQSGINVSLKGGAVDTAMAVKNSVDRAGQVQDDRLAALHLAQAGQTLFSGGQAGLNSLKGAGDQFDALANTTTDTEATGNNGLSLRIGIGASKSSSSVEYNATTAAGSRIASEGDVVIHATGDGKGDGGDLTVTGSRIEGDNVTLAAANDLVLKAQQETREQIERNKARSGEIGVTIGSEAGIGVYVSASAAKGKGDGNGTTHAETTVDAGNTLTLISGRDTTLEGAQAKGETVIADIGRNLTMTSQQDTNDYRRKDQSAGIDAAIGTGGGQISANYNQSRIDSTYTSVKEQTGIQAGEGGFDIRVGGHTQLDGAAIASTAGASLNRLETGSLGWSDLHNEAEYKASSIGGSVSGGSGGGSVSPNIAPPQHKDASSTTAAGIADGTLIVRDGSGEGIARGVTELQQDGLKEIFDLQKVQERMEMGQVAGQVGMRAAGDLAQKMGWEEGSKEKVILHGIVGAAIAALGGGDALSGLAGAAANQLASKAMQDYLRGNDIDPNSVEGRLLMELGSVAVGAAVGGGSGAASALAGEQFNRQLHPEELHYLADKAEEFADVIYGCADQCSDEQIADAKGRLIREAYARVDSIASSKYEYDSLAEAFINNNPVKFSWGEGFAVTRDQFNDNSYFKDLLHSDRAAFDDLTAALAQGGASREYLQAAYRDVLSSLADSARGKDGVDMLETFTGDVGMVLGIIRKVSQGDLQGGTLDAAIAALPWGVGKVLRPLAVAADGTYWLNGKVIDAAWVNAKGELTWVNPLTGLKELVPDAAKVQVDHILPQNYIATVIPDFASLPREIQKKLLDDPANLQPLIKSANCSKGCKVEWIDGGWEAWNGQPISAEYKRYLDDVQAGFREKVQEAIDAYKKSGG